jgi:hypothetical protein
MRRTFECRFVAVASLLFGISACFGDKPVDKTRGASRTDTAIVSADPGIGSATPAAVASGKYVGVQHDPLPAGVQPEGGALLTGASGSYAFTHVRTPHGDMIWLDTIADGTRPRGKTVRAQLTIPLLAKDERLFMASCDVDGRLDGRVLAIVMNEPSVTKFARIRQAWRVDERLGHFDLIPIGGITCEDPGGGDR